MIRIRDLDPASRRRAPERLAGRLPFGSWATGEMLVPAAAQPYLGVEGIPFLVEGPATCEQNAPTLRDPAPSPVPWLRRDPRLGWRCAGPHGGFRQGSVP